MMLDILVHLDGLGLDLLVFFVVRICSLLDGRWECFHGVVEQDDALAMGLITFLETPS